VSESLDALYEAGVAAWRSGDHARAVSLAREAIGIDPRLPALHFLEGSGHFDAGRYAYAAHAFERAAALGPDYPLALECELRAALSLARLDLAGGAEPELETPPGGKPPFVSVIVCSVTPQKFDRVGANYRRLLDRVPHEIVGVHDARSLAEGYNRGMRQARGDVLVFSHDDIEIVSPDFAAKLARVLQEHGLAGVAGTTHAVTASWLGAGWPQLCGQIGMPASGAGYVVTVYGTGARTVSGVQALDGVWLAARRETAERLGFDEATFDGWHGYDFDFSFRAHLAGERCAVAADLLIVHASSGGFLGDWRLYAGRALAKHRAHLPAGATLPAQPELCAIEVRSSDEWRLLAQRLIERREAGRR